MPPSRIAALARLHTYMPPFDRFQDRGAHRRSTSDELTLSYWFLAFIDALASCRVAFYFSFDCRAARRTLPACTHYNFTYYFLIE